MGLVADVDEVEAGVVNLLFAGLGPVKHDSPAFFIRLEQAQEVFPIHHECFTAPLNTLQRCGVIPAQHYVTLSMDLPLA